MNIGNFGNHKRTHTWKHSIKHFCSNTVLSGFVYTENKGMKGCEHKIICENTMKNFFGSTPDLIWSVLQKTLTWSLVCVYLQILIFCSIILYFYIFSAKMIINQIIWYANESDENNDMMLVDESNKNCDNDDDGTNNKIFWR